MRNRVMQRLLSKMAKMQKNKKMVNTVDFPEILSSLSLNEVIEVEFRFLNINKWENLVVLQDPKTRLYLCNVCNVVQSSEKNLFSHLFGKKHFQKTYDVQGFRMPVSSGGKNTTNKNPNAQAKTEFKNMAKTPAPAKGKVGNLQNSSVSANKPQTTPISKPVSTNAPNKQLVPQANSISKPITATTGLAIRAGSQFGKAVSTITKNNVPPKKEQVPKPNKPVQAPKVGLITKPKAAVEPAKKVLVTKPNTTVKASQNLLVTKPNTPNEASNENQVSKPNAPVEAPKEVLVTKPNTPEETSNKDPVTMSNAPIESPKDALESQPKIPIQAPENVLPKDPVQLAQNEEVPNLNITAEHKDTAKTPSDENPDATNSAEPINELVDQLQSDSSISISKSLNNLVSETKDTNLELNTVKELSDQCTNQNLVQNKAKPITVTMSKSNIVKNPLSKAAAAAKERKISCVPISKLISPTLPEVIDLADDNNADVVMLPVINIDSQPKKHKPANKDKGAVIKVVQPKAVNSNYTPTNWSGATFETLSMSSSTQILGLLGVEYVLKIVGAIKDKKKCDPRFLCTLCNINSDELSMHNHLLSNTHRLEYCEKHFPTAIRQYKQYVSEVPEHQVYKILSPILNKLAIAIETHHGRENSYMCSEQSFARDRQGLIANVFNRRHASEMLGPTFTHVVDSKEVDLLIENASNRTIDSQPPINITVTNNVVPFNPFNTSNTMFVNHHQVANNYQPPIVNTNYLHHNETPNTTQAVDDETHKRMVESFLRDTRKTSQTVRNRNSSRVSSKRDRSRSKSLERKRKRSTPVKESQWNIERRSISPLRDNDIWQAYRHMVDQGVRDLNSSFDLYKADPEKHPQYNDEWQKFWKRRKDELIATGINHRTYNYQSEWIIFFNARLIELYNQDVENIKVKCRERLCLPMTNNELIDPKYHVSIPEVVSEEPPDSPIKAHSENIHENQPKPSKEIVEDVNVIHVLRLLTALENYLGSLGPSITELLAKALQMSKLHPDKINQLILTSENCAILETAKEKFTGLIISKILDSNQERALKKAVNDTEELLTFAAEMRAQFSTRDEESNENSAETQSSSQSVQKSNSNVSYKISDQKDRSELAAKLASTLISQGKTRINQEQLKQIIQVYSLIEQKKQQETPSTTRTSTSSNVRDNSPHSMLNQNKTSNNLMSIQGNNLSTQNQCQQPSTFNPNLRNDRQEMPSTTRTSSSSNVRDNYKHNQTNLHNNLFTQNQSQQPFNSNLRNDRQTFTSQKQFMNSTMTSDMYNMRTSSNYLPANMARTNNTNFNQNPNQIEYIGNGPQHYDVHQNDGGQFQRNRQTSSLYMDTTPSLYMDTTPSLYMDTTPYSFGPTENRTGTGQNPNWN